MRVPDLFTDAYWVLPGRFLAGEYPFAREAEEGRAKVRSLLGAGVDFVMDLTEPGEYGIVSYARVLSDEARSLGRRVTRVNIPIRDFDIPPVPVARRALHALAGALDAGRTVYVHCLGGIGRTGTLVGIYFVEQGLTGDEALTRIATLRAEETRNLLSSPQSPAQRDMVRNWKPSRHR